jgi:hypothetical protein
MSDSPTIRAGARVHAFFSIARAVRFVVHLMQGGSPPPPNPPNSPARTPAPFGPPLPPGYQRVPPANTPGPSPTTDPGLPTRSSTASDKLRSTFKCPKFQGDARNWKEWNQGFIRFLAIHKLDHVIDEDFPKTCVSLAYQEDNKLVYYVLEDAVLGSPVASKYVRRAAVWNGNEAYFFLYDGFALSGPATAAILLGELGNFRFKTDENPTEMVLRLQDLFEDLESLPGPSAMQINSTQKINYLLSAIRPERSLASVYSQIQTSQVRGIITFEEACVDLRYRCEAVRADDLLHSAVQPHKVRGLLATGESLPLVGASDESSSVPALITTADKRQNRGASRQKDPVACLVKDCSSMTPPHLRLCKKCYHEIMAGKHATLRLRAGGKASFDAATQRIVGLPPSENGPRTSKAAVTFAVVKAALMYLA